jgi:NADPH2:quinone reductase
MRAAFRDRIGAARQVLQLTEMPDPVPAAGEVRVRIQWPGVNPSDVKPRGGYRGRAMPFPRVIPHSDGMGIIDALGEGVDRARVGQRVWLWNLARAAPSAPPPRRSACSRRRRSRYPAACRAKPVPASE